MKILVSILLVGFSVLSMSSQAQMSDNKKMDGMNHSMDMNKSIMVMYGWVRLTPPIAKNGAAYFTLHNSSDKDVTVVDVKTSISEKANLHDVVFNMGMAKMIHLKELVIPAGNMIAFKPGGKHLMLINLKEKLQIGKEISFTFILSNGEEITSVMKVKADDNGNSSEHQHKH